MKALDRRALAGGVAIIVVIACAAVFVASSSPDGLERVAADLGFETRAVTHYQAPLPDYGGTSKLWGALAGLLGAAAVGALTYVAGRLLARRS